MSVATGQNAWEQSNPGVNQRNEKDLEEEQSKLRDAADIMKRKAELYEKLGW